jgi:hypothetical protein
MDSLQPSKHLGFGVVAVFDEDSGDIAAGEDDDGVIILDDLVIRLCAYEAGRHEIAKLSMLQA